MPMREKIEKIRFLENTVIITNNYYFLYDKDGRLIFKSKYIRDFLDVLSDIVIDMIQETFWKAYKRGKLEQEEEHGKRNK